MDNKTLKQKIFSFFSNLKKESNEEQRKDLLILTEKMKEDISLVSIQLEYNEYLKKISESILEFSNKEIEIENKELKNEFQDKLNIFIEPYVKEVKKKEEEIQLEKTKEEKRQKKIKKKEKKIEEEKEKTVEKNDISQLKKKRKDEVDEEDGFWIGPYNLEDRQDQEYVFKFALLILLAALLNFF